MVNIQKFHTADLNSLVDRINRYSIGMDDIFDRLNLVESQGNYPPYNLVQVSNTESRLELALAGFKKNKYMSTHKTENSSSKEQKKTKTPTPNTTIEECKPTIFHQNLDPR